MAERSKVQFGKTTIPFEVRRSKLRSQVSLVVQSGQKGVLVYAPNDTPLDRLAALVRLRGAWAAAKLRQVALADGPDRPREFVSGAGFTYLGRSFRLAVHAERQYAPPRLERGWLTVTVPWGLREAGRQRAARKQVIEWFTDRASARLPERMERFAKKLHLNVPKLFLRDQGSRWGSCNEKGEVRINWRIVQAPMVLVDYVAAHEAVHLKHRNHTTAYWRELGRLLPNVDALRGELRRRGGRYVW